MQLCNEALSNLSPEVTVPSYDRQRLRPSIVHIGVGGFHRSHQAAYINDLCENGNTDWGICGAGLLPHDRRLRDALAPQDYLYTIVERDAGYTRAQVIGSITDYRFAPDESQPLIDTMAQPDTRIVSLTITEGGYCRDPVSGEFDADHPDIVHDLAHPDQPRGAFGYLLAALAQRHQKGLTPFTVLSCDNLQHNGAIARATLLAFAQLRDPALGEWLDQKGAFPNSMVDRITPATSDDDRHQLKQQFDIDDAWPVITEPFRQWVVEDNFSAGRPPWEQVGVLVTDDVQPYEMMKIRLLNASHSAMAYLGALAGFRFVHEVMADGEFRRFLRALMDQEVTPLLPKVDGVNLDQYKDTLIERFANPTINDQIVRLCGEGSAKLPKFLLPSIGEQLARNGSVHHLSLAVAGWCHYLATTERDKIQDPMADLLHRQAARAADDPAQFLAMPELFDERLRQSKKFLDEFSAALRSLQSGNVHSALSQYQ